MLQRGWISGWGHTHKSSRQAPASRTIESLFSFSSAKFFIALVLLFTAGKAVAKEHPVPLEKNTDSQTCIGCHEEKSKGKHVHSAIAMGCTSCHEVRTSKDITRIKLTATTPTALCLTCHADKNAADIKGRVHPPAAKGCTTCHDPHTSDNKFQLKKPEDGGKGQNLCLTCHTQGMNAPNGGSRHVALDSGCDTCHTTHKAGDPGKLEFSRHLAKDVPALCIDCHDTKDANLKKAHHNQPFETASCVQCHDPHQSAQPKLMQKFVHPAFENGGCDNCHKPASAGKVMLNDTDTRKLCLTCHSEKEKEMADAKVQHPGAQGECVACHNPHAGPTPGFLQPDPVNACTTCHADIAAQHKKSHLHQPVFEQGCATCHEAHGSERPKLLRADVTQLCLECHSSASKPQKVAGEPYITIFNGKVKLPEDYFRKNDVPRFEVKFGLGHPTANHPVQNVRDPEDPNKIRAEINCLSCHQAHAGDARAMLVKDQRPGLMFCRTCHKGMIEGDKQ